MPLSPHPPRQEIDPRLEILSKTAIPGADRSRRAKGLRRGREGESETAGGGIRLHEQSAAWAKRAFMFPAVCALNACQAPLGSQGNRNKAGRAAKIRRDKSFS